AHGGDAADAFDVIAPSLPGYGFSERPGGDGVIFRVGDVWHELMTGVLGYERFAAHGGDWGSTVTELLARDHAHAVIGIHLTDVPFFHAFRPPNDPSATEQTYLDGIARFGQTKGAYASVQGAQPQALAVGMSGTINSSFGPYYDFAQAGAMRWIEEKLKAWRGSVLGAGVVPAGFAMFPKDLSSPPREWAERFFDVRHWTAMPRGGHFAALEKPELLVQDIRTFFRPFR
ncbi:MAG TPA: alpha/beta hydrolase, partial [Gemmatimonadaceae bacterium]|nr:alpha/beta hydrolase [Gemmatimonadaceae bacterium]